MNICIGHKGMRDDKDERIESQGHAYSAEIEVTLFQNIDEYTENLGRGLLSFPHPIPMMLVGRRRLFQRSVLQPHP